MQRRGLQTLEAATLMSNSAIFILEGLVSKASR